MKRTITTKAAPRQLYRVVHDCQLGKPLGHARANSVVECLQGVANNRHLEPLFEGEPTGDPSVKKPVFQLISEAY